MHRELHVEHEEVAPESALDSERVRLAHELVERLLEDHQEIGRGRTSVVKMLRGEERFQDYCVKQITDNSSPDLLHDIDTEMRYQAEAITLGVRAPKPILSLTTAEGEQFMVMETIKGANLEEIIAGEHALPKGFDSARFWNSVEAMLVRLHDSGFHHRDVQLRNIMAEDGTGEAVLIDFNYATRVGGDEDPYNEPHELQGDRYRFVDDMASVRECRLKFEKYLTRSARTATMAQPK